MSRRHHDARRRHRPGRPAPTRPPARPGPGTCTRMLQAAEAFPMNLGFLGKGNASQPRARCASRSRPAPCGLKLHEDWGTTPAAIDCCLAVADEMDVQVAIHTDTLNESGFVEDTHRRLQRPHDPHVSHRRRRRRPRARHHPACAASRTCCRRPPTRRGPTRSTRIDEHLDMLMVCHHLDPGDRRGRGLRREPHPARDHRRRGHPARPRRLQHDVVRLPGDGPRRRGDHPHLADGAQDEAPARRARRTTPATTTTSASGATSPNTRSTRPSRTASRTWSARSRPASWPIWCCGRRPSSA